jgi:hypothetical protein
LDLVIEALQGNAEALKHCALVCRAWLRPSRTNLLRSPIISNLSQYDGLCALLDSDPTLEPTIGAIDTWVVTPVLTQLAPRLPNLTKLSLGMLSWSRADVEAHSSLRLPPLLTDLSLSGCTFDSCTAFAALLAVVPALRSLECEFLNCGFSEADAAAGEGLFASPVVLAELTIQELRDSIPDAAILVLSGLSTPSNSVPDGDADRYWDRAEAIVTQRVWVDGEPGAAKASLQLCPREDEEVRSADELVQGLSERLRRLFADGWMDVSIM